MGRRFLGLRRFNGGSQVLPFVEHSRLARSGPPYPGVGKTSVVDHYRRLHPPRETDTANCQPVLKVTLQPDARPKGIAADLLLALAKMGLAPIRTIGACPNFRAARSSGTVESLTNRAARLLKHCGVELIVLDEFHHLFDVDRAKVMTKASQWLKVLIVNTGLPVVVCGIPEAVGWARANQRQRPVATTGVASPASAELGTDQRRPTRID